ncbi:HK97 family phage prohead protease [uncultured Sphingomonas sp.]|uniref:HK97 family phage prohead protease n=1 Tax=uncultured Sphingomonas sp. TaxID=158754 RepID=UPI0035C9AC96
MIRFEGYAALFDRVDRAGDVFRRGAFGEPREVPLLAQHRGVAVGRVQVAEDERGLRVSGEVTGGSDGVAEGQGLSVGYRPVTVRHGARRELLAVDLIEVSLVAQPMQPLARVTGVSGD